jgi:hypothetical protein
MFVRGAESATRSFHVGQGPVHDNSAEAAVLTGAASVGKTSRHVTRPTSRHDHHRVHFHKPREHGTGVLISP